MDWEIRDKFELYDSCALNVLTAVPVVGLVCWKFASDFFQDLEKIPADQNLVFRIEIPKAKINYHTALIFNATLTLLAVLIIGIATLNPTGIVVLSSLILTGLFLSLGIIGKLIYDNEQEIKRIDRKSQDLTYAT